MEESLRDRVASLESGQLRYRFQILIRGLAVVLTFAVCGSPRAATARSGDGVVDALVDATATPTPVPIGAQCTSESECISGFCIDGRCCNMCRSEFCPCDCSGNPLPPPTPVPGSEAEPCAGGSGLLVQAFEGCQCLPRCPYPTGCGVRNTVLVAGSGCFDFPRCPIATFTPTPAPTPTLPTFTPTPTTGKELGQPCIWDDECLCNQCFQGYCYWEGCLGDCDGSGDVTVDELLIMVRIALGDLPVTACCRGAPAFGGQVTIDEIVRAVNNAFGLGC